MTLDKKLTNYKVIYHINHYKISTNHVNIFHDPMLVQTYTFQNPPWKLWTPTNTSLDYDLNSWSSPQPVWTQVSVDFGTWPLPFNLLSAMDNLDNLMEISRPQPLTHEGPI